MPLVAVVALALGGVCMWKVHQASAPGPVLAVHGPQAPEEFTPKQVTYELSGYIGRAGCWTASTSTDIRIGSTSRLTVVAHRDDHAHRGVRQYLGASSRR